MNQRPIGVFDSGLGGLTVMKKIFERMPWEDFIYLGDVAHLPYGNKSEKVLKSLSQKNSSWLVNQGVKCLVIACNTATAVAYEHVAEMFPDIPVIGVVEPGCKIAAQTSKNICIIGTKATVNSHAYKIGIHKINSQINVIERDCPLFVPMIEEGFLNHKAMDLIISEYLDKISNDVDSMVLGCTHYPLLKDKLRAKYPKLNLIDPAEAVALEVENALTSRDIVGDKNNEGRYRIYCTDITETFTELSKTILGITPKINILENL